MSQVAVSPPAVDKRVKALRRFALSITAFNVLGHLFLGFEQAYLTPIVGVLTGYVAELLLETVDARIAGRRPRYLGSPAEFVNFLLPAHIAGLACSMLLYGNESLWPTAFAVTVAVASKYLIQVPVAGRLRHVLNPSNFGISVTLVCFSWVGIAPPYEFTENVSGVLDWIIPLAVGVSGAMLNAKLTGRLPLILGWLGGFVLQALIRTVVLDHSLVSALLPMTGVAFVLFTNYMITDPGTSPMIPRRQVFFGLATALVYGALVISHITFGLFFALVIVCLARLAALTWLAVRAGRPGADTGRVPPSDAATGDPAVATAGAGSGASIR
ncbi:enediyne biosynthesis protein UnbU [Actinoplanes bogorensis]|uniref:Enediyne biosynthesis protein UnbU n=1 Tax=Paractinoplanes bogorensis TaxID=1610840 RepID=A0ABS5YW13_9ACTN|nr:enediyne biosynthesis protein UnbU [Actinoplanes bogorensis]MBU2667266.1 enediyne biosynthesis protein UnbU [Actinoplanes bogorensis]